MRIPMDTIARALGAATLFGANGLAANRTLHKDIPFDTLRDFAP